MTEEPILSMTGKNFSASASLVADQVLVLFEEDSTSGVYMDSKYMAKIEVDINRQNFNLRLLDASDCKKLVFFYTCVADFMDSVKQPVLPKFAKRQGVE